MFKLQESQILLQTQSSKLQTSKITTVVIKASFNYQLHCHGTFQAVFA